MHEPIFLSPYYQDKIWGGTKLKTIFNLDIPTDTIGEAWLISAHPNGLSTVTAPKQYEGMTLDKLYTIHPELFGEAEPTKFPLLVKILDARDDLSVQVHPDDAYGLEHEGELGKAECWYIIDADPGTELVYGHTAQSKEEFKAMVEAKDWDKLLNRVKVKAGDFLDVPAGMIHAVGGGALILETQQNSDTTYRVYDYDRPGDDGKPRELHIKQSIDVTTCPQEGKPLTPTTKQMGSSTLTHFVTNDHFSIDKCDVVGQLDLQLSGKFTLYAVIEGSGELVIQGTRYPLHLADAFIIPHGVSDITFKGSLTLIQARPQ